MIKILLTKLSLTVGLLCLAFLFVSPGCIKRSTGISDRKYNLYGVRKVVVVGFRAALYYGEKSGVVRDPLSGATFMAEPVSEHVVQKMTMILFNKLLEEKPYEFIPPGKARGVLSSIVSSDERVGLNSTRILQEVGRAFKADGVLTGYLYRWRERKGGDYGVSSPASVAFDLHIVRPADGALIWRGKFDKTQHSLSENVFDYDTFFQAQGRWMTVEKLAEMGLDKALAKMPGTKIPGGE